MGAAPGFVPLTMFAIESGGCFTPVVTEGAEVARAMDVAVPAGTGAALAAGNGAGNAAAFTGAAAAP